jgi:hypothetical protein
MRTPAEAVNLATALVQAARSIQPDVVPAADHDALVVILEALDIPFAACAGDEEIRAKILDQRLMHTLAMLRPWLDDRASGRRDDDHYAWSLAHLREQLAKHPAAGYRTDYAEVMADWAADRETATGLPDSGSDGGPMIPMVRAADHRPGCPDWCDIDDHEAWDGGDTRHHLAYAVGLSALPYEVNGSEHHESALVVLRQDAGSDPVIAVQMPPSRDEDNPANGVSMTLAEAAELRDNLTALIATGLTGDRP